MSTARAFSEAFRRVTFSEENVTVTPAGSLLRESQASENEAPAGSGPRHLAAHPAFPSLLYCVTELTGELLVLQPEGAELRLLRRIPMVPDNFDGLNTAAAIHFTENGQSLLVSHRGLDAIAVFPIDARGLPGERVVLSVGTLHAGTAENALADRAELRGIVRTLGPDARAELETLLPAGAKVLVSEL